MKFFIYLIERYAEVKNTTADQVINKWDDLNITKDIYDMYEMYHIESLQNAFDDIDQMMV